MSRIVKKMNKYRKSYQALRVMPTVLMGFIIEDVMDVLPLDQDFVRGVKQQLEAQRHGIVTAFMLLDKHEDRFFSFTRARIDYVLAAKQCLDDGTIERFVDDPDYVREVVLNI